MSNEELIAKFIGKMREVYGQQNPSQVLREASLVGCLQGVLGAALRNPECAKSFMEKIVVKS